MKVFLVVIYVTMTGTHQERIPMDDVATCETYRHQLEFIPPPGPRVLIGSYCEEI